MAAPSGRGVFGVSYTLAGFVSDERTGNGLSDGALTVNNYAETLLSRTDLFTFSYGYSAPNGTSNYGFGLVAVNHRRYAPDDICLLSRHLCEICSRVCLLRCGRNGRANAGCIVFGVRTIVASEAVKHREHKQPQQADRI